MTWTGGLFKTIQKEIIRRDVLFSMIDSSYSHLSIISKKIIFNFKEIETEVGADTSGENYLNAILAIQFTL